MPETKNNRLEGSGATGPACQKVLAETSKALKAFSFYPENHPLRRHILDSAYRALEQLLAKEGAISLSVQRSGFSFVDRQETIDGNPMTRSLAGELFARELQRITFLPGISLSEFSAFLSILAVPPQKTEEGGVAGMLERGGIRSVMVNHIDVTAVYTRKKGAQPEESQAPDAELPEDPLPDAPPSRGAMAEQSAELTVEELVAAMAREFDDDRYRQLARTLLGKALPMKSERNFDRIYRVLVLLTAQHAEPGRGEGGRASAQAVVQQLTLGEMAEHLLDHLEDAEFPHKDAIYVILQVVGDEVVDAVVKRLVAAGGKPSRRTLSAAVVRIGNPAQRALLGLLKDGRGQVVHTAVALLGEIGNREAVKALSLTVYHPDNRIRMASVRSLARIGGMEATAKLLALLREGDQALALQAVTWLGNCGSQGALQHLLRLVQRRDPLGRQQALKKEALLAIGRIGDRRALEPLFSLVRKKGLFSAARRMELKLAALEAIATLGGHQALGFLQELSAKGGELGRAASAWLEPRRDRAHD